MALGQSELLVQLAADRAHRTVAHHRQGRVDIHPRHEVVLRLAVAVHSLVGQPDTQHAGRRTRDQRFRHRHSRPDLHRTGGGNFAAHELHELPHRQHHAPVLVQERRDPGKLEAVVPVQVQRADRAIRHPQSEGALAGAHGVEQVDDFLFDHRRRHGNAAEIQIGKRGADAAGARDHPRDAEADVVGALVAGHLQRHPRHRLAFDGGSAVGIRQAARKHREKAGRGGAEAHAGDVQVHRRTVHCRAICLLFAHTG